MHRLFPHRGCAAPALTASASAEREGTELLLRFELVGDTNGLVLPSPATAPARRDELWRSTCFEVFLRPGPSEAYWELNLAPTGDWALYHFTSQRAGMTSPDAAAPLVECSVAGNRLVVQASLDLAGQLSPAVPWQLNLTCVLETRDGLKSYWALAHPPEGPPDFHHPACFVLELPPPGSS